MNRIYKSVWNAVTQTFTAVSEYQQGRGKRSKGGMLAASIFCMTLCTSAFATNIAHEQTNDILFGQESELITNFGGVNQNNPLQIEFVYSLNFEGSGHEFQDNIRHSGLESNDGSLVIQQSTGFFQSVAKFRGTPETLDINYMEIAGSANNEIEQMIVQRDAIGKEVASAVATYAIGDLAYSGLVENKDLLSADLFDNLHDNGLKLTQEGNDTVISTVAFLTMLSLEGKGGVAPFVITATETESTLFAKITGSGNLLYKSDSNANVLNLTALDFPENDPVINNAMTYIGETSAENIHLVLNRADPLGFSTKLSASNNAIVEVKSALNATDDGFLKDGIEFEAGSTMIASANVDSQGAVSFSDSSLLELATGIAFETGADLTIDGTSALSGDKANVTVGETLTVLSSNTQLNSSFAAKNVVLGKADALGTSTIAVTESLRFQNVTTDKENPDLVFTSDVQPRDDHLTVILDNSRIAYAPDASWSAQSTVIQGHSHLSIAINQLGQLGEVSFRNQIEGSSDSDHGYLTIKGPADGTAGAWNIDSLKATNDKANSHAVIIASGQGFTFNENTLAGFTGWLRLSDAGEYHLDATSASRFAYNENDPTAPTLGLSIGEGTTLKIDSHLALSKFSWAKDGTGGVLDVTGHQHSSGDYDQKEVLHVGTLYLYGGGELLIDPTQYIDNTTRPDEGTVAGSVLDYDNGRNDNRYTVIKADKVIGEDNIELKIPNSQGQEDITRLFNLTTKEYAADAYWDYVANKSVDSETGAGEVYITYGLRQLDLKGADDTGRSLVINLDSAQDTELRALVTGDGIIDIISTTEDKKAVSFNNRRNAFSGRVVVHDGVTLTSYAGSLSGDSVAAEGQVDLVLNDNSSVVFKSYLASETEILAGTNDLDQEVQYLKSIYAPNEGSTVEIQSNVALTGTGSVINGTLSGNGTLALMGADLDTNVNAVNHFEGLVQMQDKAELRLNVVQNEVLSKAIASDESSWLVKAGQGDLAFGAVELLSRTSSKLNVRVDDGSLTLNEQSPVGNVSVNDGKQVNIDGLVELANLEGNGQIALDVEFGNSDNQGELGQAGDAVKVTQTASGDFDLLVTPKDLSKGAIESVRVMDVQGDATTFELALANGQTSVVSGAYDYQLIRTDNGRGAQFDLTSVSGASDQRNTSVTAGSYIGMAYAAQLFDVSLHDRVGNRDWINPVTGARHSTSLWLRHSMSHERFRDSTAQLRMRTTSNVTMLGGDLVQLTSGETGLSYFGLMGGYGSMDTKTHSKATNLTSKAETDAWAVGAYAGWKANSDGMTGPYVDGWLMFTHADSDMTGADRVKENIKGQGLSASVEAGWGFKVASVATDNGKIANFVLEPHASATWFGMEYDDIHDEAQDVRFEGKNNVRTRLGARAIISEEGNADFNAFVEANWVHNTQEYGATLSGLRVDQAGSSNLGEARIGVDWRLTQGLSVWGRVGAAFGSDAYSEREGSVGIRYQF